ncbi:conserved hypothetical protein [uncultured Eubacteriales bacterium]|uniref:Phage gp6-like head-tail connector protein n=1 Tax=uncultured Eubacteriales bacterium TaxID=172733 RepID=A0A212J4F3_9FIRM|nr:conserved hypothetical protein [uncultured Eubacteriales bacterium]
MDQESARLTMLKSLLGIGESDNGKDVLLEFALKMVEGQVLSYINQDVLPEALERPLVLMTASYWKGAGLGNEQAAPGPVASVSRGDVSTSFAAQAGTAATAGTFDLGDGGSFFGWRETLNSYRKLRR